jgi:hypothetical protein
VRSDVSPAKRPVFTDDVGRGAVQRDAWAAPGMNPAFNPTLYWLEPTPGLRR